MVMSEIDKRAQIMATQTSNEDEMREFGEEKAHTFHMILIDSHVVCACRDEMRM
jgi:hypothetical protein